MTVISWISKRN